MNKVQKATNKGQLATVDASVFQMEPVSGFEEGSGMGDLALPFLRVLSQLSAQCNNVILNSFFYYVAAIFHSKNVVSVSFCLR